MEALAADLGIAEQVLFLGQRDDVPDLLAAADLFVLASLFEGLPLVVLEAMALDLPVVATRIGGTSEALGRGLSAGWSSPAIPQLLPTPSPEP